MPLHDSRKLAHESRVCGLSRFRAIRATAWASPADLFSKSPALLPPYTTGSVRIRSNLDIKLGRVIGGWQWRAADRRCASRCGHSSKRARGLGVAFVGALCRRIDSQGVDPRSLTWKISSPKAPPRQPNAQHSAVNETLCPRPRSPPETKPLYPSLGHTHKGGRNAHSDFSAPF